jgi:effector-binding domain-containing protein
MSVTQDRFRRADKSKGGGKVIEPKIIERAEQPYVAVRGTVTMQTFEMIVDRFPEVFNWLADQGRQPSGAPFFKFNVIDMERELEVEAGVPIDEPGVSSGEVICAVLPAGSYVTATHIGHPDELVGVTAEVLSWAADRGLVWDAWETDAGTRWACRLLVSKTDLTEEPNMDKQETELLFRLAD